MTPLTWPAEFPYGDGLRLRPFRDSDVEMIRELATDPYVPQIGSLPARATEAEALDFIARQHSRLVDGIGYPFCVADAATDEALGTISLWLNQIAYGRASVGYTVTPSARGRRIAGRALRLLLAFAWGIPEVFRVELYVEPWNAGSIRTAEAVGFLREGLLRSHQPIGGRRVDMLLYARLRADQHEAERP